ncbi:MAG: hypothetical protein GY855_14270 [candidate division Zixibacteria bacterium]|nr:hypothetical protein [candidate division Zixibacteria bacterium]
MALKGTSKHSEQLIFHLINVFIKRYKSIVVISGVIIFGALTYCLFSPPVYMASTTLLPAQISGSSSKGYSSNLADMAKRFGLGSITESNPLMLYPSILASDTIQTRILYRKFASKKFNESQPLYRIMDVKGDTEREILYWGLMELSSAVNTTLDQKTGVITLRVEASEPQLSADVTNAFVEELRDYNSNLRTSRARQNREFIERKLNETRLLLKDSEDELKEFREANLRIGNSPELLMELGRLTRKVKINEEVFLTLTEQYELAKIDEQKSTPVINVLDTAKSPISKSKPQRRNIMVFAFILGLSLGIGWSLLKETFEQVDEGDEEYRKLKLNINNAKDRVLKFASRRKDVSEEIKV